MLFISVIIIIIIITVTIVVLIVIIRYTLIKVDGRIFLQAPIDQPSVNACFLGCWPKDLEAGMERHAVRCNVFPV